MEIYRFRKAKDLLDGYQELEKQEIYFASPEQLNDPMEGFRDIFWKGDEIVWRNMLKNYLFCLEHIYLLTVIAAEKTKVDASDIPLFNYPITNYSPQRFAITEQVRKRFFERPAMDSLPGQLASRQNAIRRNELLSHLNYVHNFAVKAIEDVYLEQGIILSQNFSHDEAILDNLVSRSGNLAALYDQVENENEEKVDKMELFFQVANGIRQGATLAAFASTSPEHLFSNSMFIINEFDKAFIDKLETLLYPDWYSASFLSNCKNSAIWGNYGDSHTGICLIYEADEISGRFTLSLNNKPLTFQKVIYDKKHIEIDFFRSLGRSPEIFLEHTWYKGENGSLSPFASHLKEGTAEWRTKYWENFQKSLGKKIKEWKYEKEYRLTINGFLDNYTEKEDRKLKYDFSSLKGLIFGINTTALDKMKIINIIKEKCRKTGRKDFEFYQAFYSRATAQIEKQTLSVTNFFVDLNIPKH